MSNGPLLLILGFGLTARALAHAWRARGETFAATIRDPAKALAVETGGGLAVPVDLARPGGDDALKAALAQASHLLISIPPGPEGDPVLSVLPGIAARAPRLQWAGYLSTTGVYGDRQGGWAFEWEAPSPSQERSVRRLGAERAWSAALPQTRIFRLSGIYGPGRSTLDRVRDGTARRIVKPGQIFSRIHTEDIAAALLASMERPQAAGPFNLCDDHPCPQAEVIAGASALLGVPPPPEEPFDPQTVSPMMASFYAEDRRVSNARAKAALGWRLAYPSWREGLAAILAGERGEIG